MRNRSENQIKLVLIRHGATKSNLEHRYIGKTNESLCDEGRKRLIEYREQHIYPEITLLGTSPMKRCMETAQIIYPEIASVPISGLEEIDFGVFEGKNWEELQGDERYQAWIDSNGTLPFPEGESRNVFINRCSDVFKRFAEDVGINDIGLVVHGGVIMALISRYYGGEYFDYQVANGKGYICTIEKIDEELKIINLEKI